jgi:hypothetical protein
MTSVETSSRGPRWYLVPVRVLLVTFIVTLLSFAVSLLLGIGGVVLAAKLRGVHPNMAIAYRHIAFPVAGMVAAIVFVSAVFMEQRHYQRAKALQRIERVS